MKTKLIENRLNKEGCQADQRLEYALITLTRSMTTAAATYRSLVSGAADKMLEMNMHNDCDQSEFEGTTETQTIQILVI